MKDTLERWEPQARSVLRMVVAFLLILHGLRNLFAIFPRIAGRSGGALDSLPAFAGALEVAGGALLFLGYLTKPVAGVLAAIAAAAYLYSAAPAGPWPIRNGGNEALLYLLILLYFRSAGAGAWSVDERLGKR